MEPRIYIIAAIFLCVAAQTQIPASSQDSERTYWSWDISCCHNLNGTLMYNLLPDPVYNTRFYVCGPLGSGPQSMRCPADDDKLLIYDFRKCRCEREGDGEWFEPDKRDHMADFFICARPWLDENNRAVPCAATFPQSSASPAKQN